MHTGSPLSQERHRPGGAPSRRGAGRPGGWLVTYADLMTILVCFFVLIISYSIQDQVKMEVVAGSMRDAFGVAEKRRYAGDFKLDGTPDRRQPGNVTPRETPTANAIMPEPSNAPAAGADGVRGAFDAANADQRRLLETKEAFEKAVLTHPLLRDSAEQVRVTLVDDGLQVVIADAEGAPMFALGSAELNTRGRVALEALADIIAPLANRVWIEGHADASPATASPFLLTAARANAARELFEARGLPENRIAGVSARGASAPQDETDPYAAGNRRIEILLEKAAPLLPPDRSL
ncbi:MAG: flagellar motor protein MotB [Pseudomonadota bacterium]